MTDDELKAIEARANGVDLGKRNAYGRMELTSPGARHPLQHKRVLATAEDRDACLEALSGSMADARALVAEVRRLRESMELSAVEAGLYLGALALALADGGVEVDDLKHRMHADAYAIVREGLRSLK